MVRLCFNSEVSHTNVGFCSCNEIRAYTKSNRCSITKSSQVNSRITLTPSSDPTIMLALSEKHDGVRDQEEVWKYVQ